MISVKRVGRCSVRRWGVVGVVGVAAGVVIATLTHAEPEADVAVEEASLEASLEATVERLSAHIRPTVSEVCWQEIVWLDSLPAAVAAAQERRRPILLWAMNGHPKGCV